MSGIVDAVRRAVSMTRAESPPPVAPDPPASRRRGPRRERRDGTLNPEQVEDRETRLMTDVEKGEFQARIVDILRAKRKVRIKAVWAEQGDDFQQVVEGSVSFKFPKKTKQ